MRRAFTIIELLVASLLLGMLVTILTMVFNQSSIAWRTGKASMDDLDTIREEIAGGCEYADSVFLYDSKVHCATGLWDDNGALRTRAYEENHSGTTPNSVTSIKSALQGSSKDRFTWRLIDVGSANASKTINEYIVNIMSAGPDREFDTYDDIWSNPDEFQ